ncbi:MAG: transport-associated protein [Verrucomicrobiales bacterium]|nr:transport-associated protein [Verrucomicrobiales bacterium]
MQRTLKNLALVAGVSASVVALTGCVKTGGRTAGRYMDDRSISRKVETALEEDPVYKYPAVKVTTFRGISQLSGFVEAEEQKRRATEIVRTVMGPAEIINNIVVRPSHLTPTGRDSGTGTATGTGTGTTGTTGSSGATGPNTTIERGATDRPVIRDDTTTK